MVMTAQQSMLGLSLILDSNRYRFVLLRGKAHHLKEFRREKLGSCWSDELIVILEDKMSLNFGHET